MANNIELDNEDEDIFSNKDISQNPPSKDNRIIPTWLTRDFLSWLDRYHPEIRMIGGLSQHELARLIREFEYFAGGQYGFTVQEWKSNLPRR